MKKFNKNPYSPAFICILAIILLGIVFAILLVNYNNARANLATQQGWASGKENFDKAYEIAAMDKETPQKTLYIPNLKDQLGKNSDEVVASIGKGASVVGTRTVGSPTDKVENELVVNLTNESANAQRGTPTVVLGVNHSGVVVKISMSCNTTLLGYGALSFTDLIDNEHVIEKSISEAGLKLDDGTVVCPKDRSTYTQYASDKTTVQSESTSFSGSTYQDHKKYLWSANLTFDYSLANSKADLSYTVRTLSFSIELP